METLDNEVCTDSFSHEMIYLLGCYGSILMWLQRTVDVLSVLGFCVITFLKMCFAFILRYELKEMIQKIRVLKGNASSTATPLHELEAYLPRPSVQQESSFLIGSPGVATSTGVSTGNYIGNFIPGGGGGDISRRRMTRASGPFLEPNPLLSPPLMLSQYNPRRHSSVTAITAAFQSGLTSSSFTGFSGGGLLASPREDKRETTRDDKRDEKTTKSFSLTSQPSITSSSTATGTTVVDVMRTGSLSSGNSGVKRGPPPPPPPPPSLQPHEIITANKTALKSAAVPQQQLSQSATKGRMMMKMLSNQRSGDASGASSSTSSVDRNKSKIEPSMV